MLYNHLRKFSQLLLALQEQSNQLSIDALVLPQ